MKQPEGYDQDIFDILMGRNKEEKKVVHQGSISPGKLNRRRAKTRVQKASRKKNRGK